VQERINALNARLHEAEQKAARVAELEKRAILAERRADSAAHAQIQHPAVAAHVSSQYDAYAAHVGEGAKSYGEWLKTDAATNPLVSPYLGTPAAAEPVVNRAAVAAATTAPAAANTVAPPPNPNAGAIPSPVTPPITSFSEQAVRSMSDAEVKANLPAILEQMKTEGAIKYTPPAPRT